MKNKKYKSIYMIMILLLLMIGVGYAILQANLQINGTTKIANNTWNIHFANIQVNSESVSIGDGDSAATIDPENNCKVDFSVTLNVPGDFYEFTVDVVNAGTIDGMIGTLNKTLKVNGVVVDSTPDYLNYTVTYLKGKEILEHHLLAKNTQETYKVRVEYKSDIDELPDAATISTSIEPVFLQADETAISVKPYNPCTYDGELAQGAEYVNGQYTYRYKSEIGQFHDGFSWVSIENDGWGVIATDSIITNYNNPPVSSSEPKTTKLCTSINGKPIVSMANMFYSSNATSIDLSSFDTSHVINMANMFSYSQATTLDLSSFDTSNVTNMSSMFADSQVTTLDLSSFDTSNVTNMGWMFANCTSVTTAYAKTQADADRFNASSNKPSNITFVVKS